MKILTQEEKEQALKKPIIDDVMSLKIAEACLIEKAEWKYKSSVNSIITNYAYKLGMSFSVKRLPSGKGWVVTRVA